MKNSEREEAVVEVVAAAQVEQPRKSRIRTFDIPAIDNEFEVLAQRLGIADGNYQERSKIEMLGEQEGIRSFKYHGKVYSVARIGRLPGRGAAVEFNSNWYVIQELENATMTEEQIQERLGELEMSLRGDETDDDYRADVLDEISELEGQLEDLPA